MPDRNPVAFMSYVHSDDDHDRGRITELRVLLEGEVRMQTGKSFAIFQDRNDIRWGQNWAERITQSLTAHVSFLMPVVTPSFLESPACRDEFEVFLRRETTLGVQFLILPLYYVSCDRIENRKKGQDTIADILAARQWTDWRQYRLKSLDDEAVRAAIADMALKIKGAIKAFEENMAAANAKARTTSSQKRRQPQKKGKPRRASTPPPRAELPSIELEPLHSEKVVELRSSVEGVRDRVRPLKAYYAYTKKYDEVIHARDLAEPAETMRLYEMLAKRASNLQHAHAALLSEVAGLAGGAQKISITILLDNSGSMRGQPIADTSAWMQILIELFDQIGLRSEVLGFTTRAWKGGQSRELWLADGKPKRPGRLNDIRHIIYKAFDESAREASPALALMWREGLLKENIDGEALLWAHSRLTAEKARQKLLFVVSDGAPVDDSTLSVNTADLLPAHLRAVLKFIDDQGDVSLHSIGIGKGAAYYYENPIIVDSAEGTGVPLLQTLMKALQSKK